jgi:hypothetical protein
MIKSNLNSRIKNFNWKELLFGTAVYAHEYVVGNDPETKLLMLFYSYLIFSLPFIVN